MRAALLEQAGAPLRVVDDVDIDAPGPGEVRVRVSHCGLCHSDVTVIDAGYLTPIIVGHEAAGVVESVGDGVNGLAPGDRVVLTPIPPCGRCYWCVRAETGLCVNGASVTSGAFADGRTRLSRGGAVVYRGVGVAAFAEMVLTHATGAVKVADDVPLEVACVIGCAVQTGVGAVFNTAAVRPGDTVLVIGLGGIGQAAVQGARLAGASRVIASDPIEARREAAQRLGATDVIDPSRDDVVARVRELTGVGADHTFECVGSGALIETAIETVRSGGKIVMVGAPPIDHSVTINNAVLFGIAEKKLMGCFIGSSNSLREIPRLVDLWRQGSLDLEGMITHRRPLAEINDAFDDLAASRGIRTVVSLA
jgi:Zn-dependent alcohol dehydrogenase